MHPLFRLGKHLTREVATLLTDEQGHQRNLRWRPRYRDENPVRVVMEELAWERFHHPAAQAKPTAKPPAKPAKPASAAPAKPLATATPRKPQTDAPVPKPPVKPAAAKLGAPAAPVKKEAPVG